MPNWEQVLLCVSLIVSVGLDDGKKAEAPSNQSQNAPPTTYATPTPDQLYHLVAPIALFPDNLVAQVLAVSTDPDQTTVASQWRQQSLTNQGSATPGSSQSTRDPSPPAVPSRLNNIFARAQI